MTYGTGTITPMRRGNSTRYRVRIPDGRGGYKSLGVYGNLEEAERMRSAGLVASADATTLGGIDLYSYGERYINRCGLRDVKTMRSRWKTIVANAPFVRQPLAAITRNDVRDWVRALRNEPARRSVFLAGTRHVAETGRPLAWRSAKHALALVARVLDEAREEGLISENVARGIKLTRQEQTKESWTWLTPAEIGKVLALDLTDEQRTALTVAIYQGLRLGELAALTWEHVELAGQRPSLVIAASWKTSTKTGKVRRIPLLEPARDALKRWRPNAKDRTGLVFPSPRKRLYAKGHAFGWDGGYYRTADGTIKRWARLPERAAINRHVRFHDLRHYPDRRVIPRRAGTTWRAEDGASLDAG